MSKVLTRRTIGDVDYPEPDLLTNSLDDLLKQSDVLFECSGDPIHATSVIAAAIDEDIPVVTLNSEFHVTAGSYFVGRGLVSEAEGDQPGSLAALDEEAAYMGFKPIVYGNMKGFLNHNPTREEMVFWSRKQGLSLEMTTSFTDGTKLQVEQALVANGLKATISTDGLLGPTVDDFDQAADVLGSAARDAGTPISDYVLSASLPHGVFVVAEHHDEHQAALAYFKMGDGPFYVLQKPSILVHLEVVKTIDRVLHRGIPLLDNSLQPTVSVAAVAKQDLDAGQTIRRGIGSFEVRGVAVKMADNEGHVPIGLLSNAVITRRVPFGETVTFDDVELPDSLAVKAWLSLSNESS